MRKNVLLNQVESQHKFHTLFIANKAIFIGMSLQRTFQHKLVKIISIHLVIFSSGKSFEIPPVYNAIYEVLLEHI